MKPMDFFSTPDLEPLELQEIAIWYSEESLFENESSFENIIAPSCFNCIFDEIWDLAVWKWPLVPDGF